MNTATPLVPLVVIPARGGSKGIPRKNIKPFCGRPLIAWTIDVALALTDTSHIIFSTDDQEIADAARREGLNVDYMRPPSLATDTSGSREVLLDAMEYADSQGIAYDVVVLLQPTSPLRTLADVTAALELYSPETDMVVSVCQAAANPYYDCFETGSDGFLAISKGDGKLTRRQDAPDVWQYNGAVYVINPESLRHTPFGLMTRRIPSPMPRERSVDLDSPLDWQIAELICTNR